MIHERVRHARLYLGWSQTQLAEMVGISQPAISQIEKTGQVSGETLEAIASVTGFSPWWFQQGPLPDLPMGSLRFRKRAGTRPAMMSVCEQTSDRHLKLSTGSARWWRFRLFAYTLSHRLKRWTARR